MIIAAIRKVLQDAIESGGSSLRDFLHVSGEAGYFQHRFNVYGRGGKPCFSVQETHTEYPFIRAFHLLLPRVPEITDCFTLISRYTLDYGCHGLWITMPCSRRMHSA